MKLNPKKGNYGHITSYTVIIGSKEARDCGLIDKEGKCLPIKKTIDPKNKRIIISADDSE